MTKTVIRSVVSTLLFPLLFGEGTLLKNGDFEKFAAGEPIGWTTNNIPNMLSVVSSSPRSFSGKTSVKCEVKDFYGTKMAGMLNQKGIKVNDGELRLTGVYALKSIGHDAGYVSIDVRTEGNSTIASCEHYLADARNEFVSFRFSAKLPEEATQIDILLTLMAEKSGGRLHEGSTLLLDALKLSVTGGAAQQVQ